MRKSDPELNKKIGERIKQCRIAKNMSRSELGEKVNLTGQHIYNIETGRRGLSASNAFSFARALDVSPEYLLCESEYKSSTDYENTMNEIMSDIQMSVMRHISYVGYMLHGFLWLDDGKIQAKKLSSVLNEGKPDDTIDFHKIDYFVYLSDSETTDIDPEKKVVLISRERIDDLVIDIDGLIRTRLGNHATNPIVERGYEAFSTPSDMYPARLLLNEKELIKTYVSLIEGD